MYQLGEQAGETLALELVQIDREDFGTAVVDINHHTRDGVIPQLPGNSPPMESPKNLVSFPKASNHQGFDKSLALDVGLELCPPRH